MCGLTGILSSQPLADLRIRLTKMNDSIAHRGPDAHSVELIKKTIGLGHRRLSIIDVREIANQPMKSENGEWTIVFNGEIYNFQDIKSELNYEFQTNSDTEVILAAVQEFGIDWFLEKANGMFAIALHNNSTNTLHLIRDRLGIKPLYYHVCDEHLIFGSEIKSILNSGLVNAEFNTNAVDEYLGHRYVREPFTFFDGILQVESGMHIVFQEDLSHEKKRFWQLPTEFNSDTEYNETQVLERFENELNLAIERRLISDVPLGTYLSGGVDSSIITAIASKKKKEAVKSFTIGFPELNEFEHARLVADKYGTEHHELLMQEKDYFSQWKSLIYFKDAPLGVPNEIPLAAMSSELKKDITVVLSGEGADELLGGYGRIFRSAFDFENTAQESDFYSYLMNKYEYVPRALRDKLLSTEKDYRAIFDNQVKKEFGEKSNEENIFRYFHNYHVKGLLQRVDITTMQTSVEARVPFLDHKLVEFTYKYIPYGLKLKWINEEAELKASKKVASEYSEELDIPKYALRKVAYNYLPASIIERKKIGFPVPLKKWFPSLEKRAKEELKSANWINNEKLDVLIEESRTNQLSGQILWMFINIELFRKQYFEKEWRW